MVLKGPLQMQFMQSGRERGGFNNNKKLKTFMNLIIRDKWKRGKIRLLGTFFHLCIVFNPGVSFESMIYHWKSFSGIFLMDRIGT